MTVREARIPMLQAAHETRRAAARAAAEEKLAKVNAEFEAAQGRVAAAMAAAGAPFVGTVEDNIICTQNWHLYCGCEHATRCHPGIISALGTQQHSCYHEQQTSCAAASTVRLTVGGAAHASLLWQHECCYLTSGRLL